MSVRAQATSLLREGRSPTEVAQHLGKNLDEVARMLFLQIGEGDLTFAEVLFNIPALQIQRLEELLERKRGRSNFSFIQSCRSRGIGQNDIQEAELYERCRDAVSGDMYLVVRRLEVRLHGFVRGVLEAVFPGHDDAWWKNGVPLAIRKRCVQTREEDNDPFDPYSYTNFIDLKLIIEGNWPSFLDVLPPVVGRDKKALMRDFDRLNSIRNRVMHPTKLAPVVRDEYEYVCKMERRLFPQEGDGDEDAT